MSYLFGKGAYNKAMTRDEEDRVMRTGYVLITAAFIFMGGLTFLVHRDVLKLYPDNYTPDTLKGYASRVEYALRYQTLLVLWLIINTLITIFARFSTRALNPLDDKTEQRVQLFKNILTNSFETIVISVFSQLIFVSFAKPEIILKFIPLVNVIQFVGRAAFLAGYPLLRAFGFISTFVPSVVLTGYNVYRFYGFFSA